MPKTIKKNSSANSDKKNIDSDNLIELASTLIQQNDLDEIFRIIVQKTVMFLDAEIALILLVNPSTNKTVKTIFKEGREIKHKQYRSLQNQVSGWILKNDSLLLSKEIKIDHRFSTDYLVHINHRSVIVVPLKMEGQIIGTIIVLNKNQN